MHLPSGVSCVITKSKDFEIRYDIVALGKLWLIYALKKTKAIPGNEKNKRFFFQKHEFPIMYKTFEVKVSEK